MSKLPISKKQIKTSIYYDWYKYVLVLVLSSVVWYFFFNLKDGIKNTEIIQIFSSAEVVDKSLTTELETKYSDSYILDFRFYTVAEDSEYEDYLTENQGLYNSDIILLRENKCNDALLYKCIEFDTDLQNQCLSINPNIEFVKTEDNEIHGVVLNKKDDQSYNDTFTMSSFFKMDEDYVLTVPIKSVNAGRYSSKAKEEHDMAITTFLYLLGRTND